MGKNQKFNFHGIYRIDVDRIALTGYVNGYGDFHQNIASVFDFHLMEFVRKLKIWMWGS